MQPFIIDRRCVLSLRRVRHNAKTHFASRHRLARALTVSLLLATFVVAVRLQRQGLSSVAKQPYANAVRGLAEDKKSRNRIKDAYYLYFSQNSILLAYKQSRVYSLLPKIFILFQANQSTAKTFGAVLSASYTILWLKILLLYYTTFSLVNCFVDIFCCFFSERIEKDFYFSLLVLTRD